MARSLVHLAANAVLASAVASRAASGMVATTEYCCEHHGGDLPTGA